MQPLRILALFTLAALTFSNFALRAEEAAPGDAPASGVPSALNGVFEQIKAGFAAGRQTPEALKPELDALDKLIVALKAEKSAEAPQAMFMKAVVYVQAFDDTATAKSVLTQLESEFPGTQAATGAHTALEQIAAQEKAKQAKDDVVGQPAPELNFTWTSREGAPTTLSALKGKVVVLDFWATWCGPCVRSFPHVAELTQHYVGLPVEVIGVTSLQGAVHGLGGAPIDCKGDPAKEQQLMNDFIKAKAMTWLVAFSKEEVFNPAYGVTGIPHMAIIAPDGTVRFNGLHPASPLEEKVAKIDALLKEFNLPTQAPAKS